MASPLLIVFVFQLVVKFIATVGADVINELIWNLYNKLPSAPTSNAAQEEIRLRREVLRLKREMNSVSAQDDFARWAKIRRQHDKAQEDHKRLTSNLSSTKSSFTSTLNTIRFLAVNLLRFYIQWNYFRQPVYWLPKGWIPGWGEWILSFPSSPRGSVSIQAWQLACGAVVAMMAEAVGALIVLLTGNSQITKERKDRNKIRSQG